MLGVLHYNKWLIKKKSINHNLARYEVTSDKALNNCQKFQFRIKFLVISVSAAVSGWAGWALAHPELGGSVSPILTRRADYAHHITVSPPGFENPAASLSVDQIFYFVIINLTLMNLKFK